MKTRLLIHAKDASELLKKGEIVALPTETVYGLAGNATDPSTVKKIFAAKERPAFDPLIVHISKKIIATTSPLEILVKEKILATTVLQWKNRVKIEAAMLRFWPGPLTLILPRGQRIPGEVTSGQDTVGIRCPQHPLFQEVLAELPFPLAAPSANRFGRISPTTAEHVKKELNGKIAGILDGGSCEVGVESSILKITEENAMLLRPGKISAADLEKIFGPLSVSTEKTPIAPGMLDEHYAPRKPLYLLPLPFEHPLAMEMLSKFPEFSDSAAAFLAMNCLPAALQRDAKCIFRVLSSKNSLEEMARNLFATLRELDENEKVSIIFADSPSSIRDGLGASLFDRLRRASRNKPSSPS